MGLINGFRNLKGVNVNIAVIYILLSVLASAVGQLLLKKGMNSMGEITLSFSHLPSIIWQMATNLNVFIGLAIYLAGTIFWLAALSRVDLSFAYPFAGINYIVMLVASWLMFDEKITIGRVIGSFVIAIGVILVSR
jgi:drug/metabolite transporter (DMT)-like permease